MGSVWLADAPRARHPLRGQVHRGRVAASARAASRASSARPRPRRSSAARTSCRSSTTACGSGTPVHRHGAPRGRGPRSQRLERMGAPRLRERRTDLSRRSRARSPRAHAVGHRAPRSQARQHLPRPDDDGEIAKVLDFGVAKWTATGRSTASPRPALLVGTPLLHEPRAGARHQEHRPPRRSLVARRHRLPVRSPASCPS